MLVAVVWVLSFIICFPPLVGWKDREDDELWLNVTLTEDELYNLTTSAPVIPVKPCRWICELTNDAGYVVY
ncbi:probable G-protein coupled receptor No9, partial [Copidosoma floridanum]